MPSAQLKIFDVQQPAYSHKVELVADRNRHGNNEVFQANKEHFSNQTEIVLAHLRKGEKVSGKLMSQLHDIQDIRPRIAAIKKLFKTTGEVLTENKIKGGHGAKEWFIEETKRAYYADMFKAVEKS